jgi:hypothetical protein
MGITRDDILEFFIHIEKSTIPVLKDILAKEGYFKFGENSVTTTTLEEYGIFTKAEWKSFILKNHPDKRQYTEENNDDSITREEFEKILHLGKSMKW